MTFTAVVTLPGAFVRVLVSTGSAAQAGAMQVVVIVAGVVPQSDTYPAIVGPDRPA